MMTWIARLFKWLPGLGGLLGRLAGASDRARELRAQAEQADLEGFHRTGRISAMHAWKYVKVGVAALMAVAFAGMLFFPQAAENAAALMAAFADAVARLFSVEM